MNINSPLYHPKTTAALKGLQSNIAYKLLFVNMTAMVIPRIYIDYHRNKYAGQETAFYESYSVATNYALPGLMALGTAAYLNKKGNPLGINTKGWIGKDYVDSLSDTYRQSLTHGTDKADQAAHSNHPDQMLDRFLQKTLRQMEGTHSLHNTSQTLTPEQARYFASKIKKLVGAKSPDGKTVEKLGLEIAHALGTFDRVAIKNGDKKLPVSPNKLIQHLAYLGHEFKKAHTADAGENGEKLARNVEHIGEKLTKSIRMKTAVSLGVVAGFGFAAQFINRKITERRTGQRGFVGYSDFGQAKEPKKGHKLSKSKEDDSSDASNPNFGGKLEASQFLPTANQLKYVIYPLGIVGKLLASRAMDEARETFMKAGFAYFNFLFIPNLIENLAAHTFRNRNAFSTIPEKKIGTKKPTGTMDKTREAFNRFNKSSIRSYNDIEVFSKQVGTEFAGIADNVQLNEKLQGIVKKPEKILKTAMNDFLTVDQRADVIAKGVQKELNGVRNISTLAGLTYACLTLGIGLNLLNIYITNRRHNRNNVGGFDIPDESAASAKAKTATKSSPVPSGNGLNSPVLMTQPYPFPSVTFSPDGQAMAQVSPFPAYPSSSPYGTQPFMAGQKKQAQ